MYSVRLSQVYKLISRTPRSIVYCDSCHTTRNIHTCNIRNIHTSNILSKKTALAEAISKDQPGQLTLGEKVKENTRSASYGVVIVVGVGVIGYIFYYLFNELFSGKSPDGVYSKAYDDCVANTKVQDMLGEPIKGYGEETRRGRRRHPSHMEFMRDDVKHMRMKFYLKGSRRKATVHLEVSEDAAGGSYSYRYLFAQLDDYPYTNIILEDNRK